jgi:hypothetical protein
MATATTRPSTCFIDATRAGCCARLIGPNEGDPLSGTPCPYSVTLVGAISLPHDGRVLAFSCDRHQDLLTDPVLYGTQRRHIIEMHRRRHRSGQVGREPVHPIGVEHDQTHINTRLGDGSGVVLVGKDRGMARDGRGSSPSIHRMSRGLLDQGRRR